MSAWLSVLTVAVANVTLANTAVAAPEGGISTKAEPPDAACPRVDDVRRALADRFRGSGAGAAKVGWSVAYRTLPSRDKAASPRVVFELRDPMGTLKIRRELEGTDCRAFAEAMAIVVESHFRELGWTSGAPLPDVQRPSLPTGERRPLSLGAGPAWLASAPSTLWLQVDLRVPIFGPIDAVLGALVTSGQRSEGLPGGGTAYATRWPVRLGLEARKPFRSWIAHLGMETMLSYERAWSVAIAQPGENWGLVGSIGAVGRAVLPLSPRWFLGLGLAAHRVIGGPRFAVDRFGTVLDRSAWDAVADVGVRFVPSP